MRDLLQRQECGIAEAGKHHRIGIGAMLGVGFERGVAGNRVGRAACHITCAEAAADSVDLGTGATIFDASRCMRSVIASVVFGLISSSFMRSRLALSPRSPFLTTTARPLSLERA